VVKLPDINVRPVTGIFLFIVIAVAYTTLTTQAGVFSFLEQDQSIKTTSGDKSRTVTKTVPANTFVKTVQAEVMTEIDVRGCEPGVSAKAFSRDISVSSGVSGSQADGFNSDVDSKTIEVNEYITENRSYSIELSANVRRKSYPYDCYDYSTYAKADGNLKIDVIRDTDADRILNPDDNCPNEKGSEDRQGCPWTSVTNGTGDSGILGNFIPRGPSMEPVDGAGGSLFDQATAAFQGLFDALTFWN